MERHQKKEHGLTEKGNVIENSVGMAVFQQKRWLKETVIGKEQRRFVTDVISASTILTKD